MEKMRKPHRTTYGRLLEFMRLTSIGPAQSIPELSAANYQNWLFGKELGFLQRKDRMIEMTPLGDQLLGYSSEEDRRRLFRARLEGAPSFAILWNAILQWSDDHTRKSLEVRSLGWSKKSRSQRRK